MQYRNWRKLEKKLKEQRWWLGVVGGWLTQLFQWAQYETCHHHVPYPLVKDLGYEITSVSYLDIIITHDLQQILWFVTSVSQNDEKKCING